MTTTPAPVTSAPAETFLDPVSERQWRVLDARVPDETSAAVRGFICAVLGVYEVTTIARPLDVVFCSDLEAAQLAVLDPRR